MYTQCPQCQTVFRVTATMLKAARGKVRCGRCAHVFNALTFLIDSENDVEGAAGEPTAEIVEEALPAEQVIPAESPSPSPSPPLPPSASQLTPANPHVATADVAPAKTHAEPAPPRRPAERRYDDYTPLEELEEELKKLDAPDDEELVLVGEEESDETQAGDDPPPQPDEIVAADAGTGAEDGEEEEEDEEEELQALQLDDAVEDVDEDAGDVVEGADEDVPESALEFTATNLEQVFIEVPAAPVAHLAPDPDSSNDATAEHEIIDIELEETPAPPEVITLEGDSVVIVEESGAKKEFHTGEYTELQEDKAAAFVDEVAAAAALVAKKPKTQAAIDAEVQEEIEKAFAADPTTRAEFVLPSGRRVSLHRNDDEVEVEEIEAATALERDTSKQRRSRIAWGAGGALLAFALILQIVHYKRQALVQTAVIGPVLSRVYGAIGSELSPPWDVRAFELRQWGAAADAGSGTLRVRASLLNGAPHAQPYPLLRLTLQDRFGERLRQRDLEPRDYLPRPPASGQLLGAGQRVDADIVIVDPGADAENFEIDVCMRKQAAVTCAHDALRQQG